ncbi:hypothetical protein MYU51_003517 [Penicillium brevicompactum]|uniref:uncharacterized protein n=1 Tax=Penicillium brevicompactum TaxID=5074 RepID=UPI00254216E0|nr:uncharacterized protein N7506_002492 [Penicillium brevicompactum]KAJ5344127.1 hypothetical protein N7506_002492 [Penicillium brevicompactum]
MHSQSYPQRSLSQTSTSSSRSNQSKKSSRLPSKLSSKIFRSKSPAPIDIPKTRTANIPRSNPEDSYFSQSYTSNSPADMSPTISSPQSPKSDDEVKRASTPTRKTSGDYKRYSGTVNHCGRHSNDWLFGGFSVRESVRDGLEKLRHSDKEG